MKPAQHAETRWRTLAREVIFKTWGEPLQSRIEIIHYSLLNRYAREVIRSRRKNALRRDLQRF